MSHLRERLDLLFDIAKGAPISQKALSRRLGISVGLINALIKRAASKGLIKIKQAPAGRYVYYLTPLGFAEKGRLVAEYVHSSLDFFRRARASYAEIFDQCERAGHRRVMLCGAGELAEIATLAAQGTSVAIVGVLDREVNHATVAGHPVVRDVEAFASADGVDAAIVTDDRDPQSAFDELAAVWDGQRVLAPAFLRVTSAATLPHEPDESTAPPLVPLSGRHSA